MGALRARPITLRDARAYVAEHHRHSVPPRGHKFSIGADVGGELVGVAIVGRPVARHADDGYTAEVLRVCTDGTRNACSLLYGACRRASVAMGYRRVITYTREDESGASLKAAGFRLDKSVPRQSWDRPGRPRVDRDERIGRNRWVSP